MRGMIPPLHPPYGGVVVSSLTYQRFLVATEERGWNIRGGVIYFRKQVDLRDAGPD